MFETGSEGGSVYHIWGHGWVFLGGGVGNSGLKANLVSTSSVITSSNYHNSPAYLMRLITWACLLSISRGCVASLAICTKYCNIFPKWCGSVSEMDCYSALQKA